VRYWLHCAHLLVDGQKCPNRSAIFTRSRTFWRKDTPAANWLRADARALSRAVNFTWEGMVKRARSPASMMVGACETVAEKIDTGKTRRNLASNLKSAR
jgi:hypothetical protein